MKTVAAIHTAAPMVETTKQLFVEYLLVLAQGSMARMEHTLQGEIGKPVLASPVLGVWDVKKTLARVS